MSHATLATHTHPTTHAAVLSASSCEPASSEVGGTDDATVMSNTLFAGHLCGVLFMLFMQ